jgi:uncharacterized protein YbjT (DUF2867 family)
MSATVLVTGANGRSGRVLVDVLLAQGAKVRGLVRKADQQGRLQGVGAEAVLGDLEDPASLVAAVEGCDAVVHIGPPMHVREAAMTKAILAAAKAAGVGRFIYWSVMHPLLEDVISHRQKLMSEASVVASGMAYTILQPIRYMQHLDTIWRQVRDDGDHAMPFNTQVTFNVVDLRDLATATATVATQPGYLYATYELAGPEALSQTDMAAIIAEELGKPVVARAIALEALRDTARAKGMTEERIESMVAMNHHYDLHGFRGNPNSLRMLLGREPATFRSHVRHLVNQA